MRPKVWIAAVAAGVVVIAAGAAGWRFHANKAELAAEARALQSRAEQGDAEAEAKLGTAHLRGRGVPQDYDAALRWYRKSAAQGWADGEVGIGAAYYYGYGVKPDYAESMRWYRKAAEQGNAAGETGVAYLYEHGDGVAQDYAQALRWYRKAADLKQKRAEEELGYIYSHGIGVPQDYGQALIWYREAADEGEAQAEYDLGRLYYYGEGVPTDRAKAMKLIGKAADGGDEMAQRYLTPNFSPVIKATLVAQLVGGIFLLSFAPVKLNYFGDSVGWDRDRTVTIAAGLLCIVGVGLRFYGYTHFTLRRLGKPLNAFTCLTWLVEIMMTAALVYVVRIDKSKKPQSPLGRSEIQTEN